MVKMLRDFMRLEAAGGLLLAIATVLALIAANSPLRPLYDLILDVPLQIRIGDLDLHKPLLLWINDGLMAVFFLLVGIELKRELVEGHLRQPGAITMPALAAIGGMAIPALLYAAVNAGDPTALRGWAIPAATDIAFALGVLSLLGSRVPAALKILLLALAILDDLGAIIVIALFYTESLSTTALGWALVFAVGLAALNLAGVRHRAGYVLLGIAMWASVLKSGVHATLAGVVLAAFIPLRADSQGRSMAHEIEQQLHPWVAFGILPLFAFVNAGLTFGDGPGLLHPIPLGILLGLVIGKPLGIVGMIWLGVRLGWGSLPEGCSWRHVIGLGFLCGIGFTMSLFIGSLAFEYADTSYLKIDRIGILAGSVLAGTIGAVILASARGPAVGSHQPPGESSA